MRNKTRFIAQICGAESIGQTALFIDDSDIVIGKIITGDILPTNAQIGSHRTDKIKRRIILQIISAQIAEVSVRRKITDSNSVWSFKFRFKSLNPSFGNILRLKNRNRR